MKTSLALVLIATLSGAQSPQLTRSSRLDPKTQLGWMLFESPLLSLTRDISCASCHDPMRSFTDGETESRGVLGVRIARNSPTLYGLGKVPGFPDPKLERGGSGAVHAMGLEERCLAPIGNPQEMGVSIKSAIANLSKIKGMAARFDASFEAKGVGITEERIGEALASFVRAREAPMSPYRDYLLGNPSALTREESAGLQVFQGKARCDRCHGGAALSDGLMHVVFGAPTSLPRVRSSVGLVRRNELIAKLSRIAGQTKGGRPRRGRTTKITQKQAKKLLAALSIQAGSTTVYYGPQAIERQTLPLWDVSRTGPYFRDGRSNDLELAVKEHMASLRAIAATPDRIDQLLAGLRGSGLRSPRALRPQPGPRPSPAELAPKELRQLLAFLHSLSPRRASHHRRGPQHGDD